MENKAKTLFIKKMHQYKIDDIQQIKLLSGGFTNYCYYFKTKDFKEYFVRIGNKKIERTNEYAFLIASQKIKEYFYYSFNNGDAIRTWVKGHTATFEECSKIETFDKIAKEIKKMHLINLKKVRAMKIRDFYIFLKISKIDQIYVNKYKEIIEKYKNLDLVISHNDIRPSNIIINGKKVIIIDFEWCSLNNQYWDLANAARELFFPLDKLKTVFESNFKNLDFEILKDMLFATTCFAVQWTFFEKTSPKLLEYRNNAIKIMINYYKLFY